MEKLGSFIKAIFVLFFIGVLPWAIYAQTETKGVQTNADRSYQELSNMLGWVHDARIRICHGYYQEPIIPFAQPGSPDNNIVTSSQDYAQSNGDNTLLIGRQVKLRQPGQLLTADKALLIRNPDTHDLETIRLYGNVKVREPGELIAGPYAELHLPDHTGFFRDVIYRYAYVSAGRTQTADAVNYSGLNGWGYAQTAKQLAKKLIELDHATYTTCAPENSQWDLKARKVILNKNTGWGQAYNAVLRVKKIPIFYTPYINFPIDKRRKTGFLFPTIGSSSQSGTTFELPFYWNMAPNYDMTITPHYYEKRGTQWSDDFRYLTPDHRGTIEGTFLQNDKVFDDFKAGAPISYAGSPGLNSLESSSDTRRFIHFADNGFYGENWNSVVDITHVSDDYYFQDFGRIPQEIAQDQLEQHASLGYDNAHWDVTGLVERYQTLHPVNEGDVSNVYSRLPEIQADADYPEEKWGTDWTSNFEAVQFVRQRNSGETSQPIDGERYNWMPGVSLPMIRPEGYITPSFQMMLTQYNLRNTFSPQPANINRYLPIFSVDSGLNFSRNFSWFGTAYQQTLQPEFYYIYIPYRNQDDIPEFEAVTQNLSYQQLFSYNQFGSIDHVSDANQVSVGATTRFIDAKTGYQKLIAHIGDIVYFTNRNTCPFADCTQGDPVGGNLSLTSRFSPMVGDITYNITPVWSASSDATWYAPVRQIKSGDVNTQYIPEQNKIFNLGYSFVRNGDPEPQTTTPNADNLNQVHTSMIYPLRENWHAIMGVGYNLTHKYGLLKFAGIEYNDCCWAIRLVASSTFTNLDNNGKAVFDHSTYLQFIFKGMGGFGKSNPSGYLTNNVPGYIDTIGRGIA